MEPATGAKERNVMKKNKVNKYNLISYTDEPLKLGKRVVDFLPKPDDLVLKEKKIRVTLTLTQKSLNFFKKAAQKHGASYQAMIRRLIDYYVINQTA